MPSTRKNVQALLKDVNRYYDRAKPGDYPEWIESDRKVFYNAYTLALRLFQVEGGQWTPISDYISAE